MKKIRRFLALLTLFVGAAGPLSHAAAEDMWVYRGYDDVDYYLKDETIHLDGDDWLADVELVDPDGETKFVATFRFRQTGRWLDDIEERTVAMWWKSKGKWIDMGLSSKDPLAMALWVDGMLPYVGGDDAASEEGADPGADEAAATDAEVAAGDASTVDADAATDATLEP